MQWCLPDTPQIEDEVAFIINSCRQPVCMSLCAVLQLAILENVLIIKFLDKLTYD